MIIASEQGLQKPLNVETPTEALDKTITPSNLIYTRSHFSVPVASPITWRLVIEKENGKVDPDLFSFSLEDLQSMPQKTVTAVLECAGNGRRGFGSPVEGEIQWGEGAVGNATWTGVPLCELLEKCGLSRKSHATLFFEGLDKNNETEREPNAENGLKFVRYLSVEKAMDGNTIVALQMNGAELSPDHGYPARLLVPGWYAMSSVKWLSRIQISKKTTPHSYFNDVKYVFKQPDRFGKTVSVPVTEIKVKSIINSPMEDEILAMNKTVTIRGKSWSGSGKITRVELKTGRDSEWLTVELDRTQFAQMGQYAWSLWKKDWTPKKEGNVTLTVRATDEKGNIQPESAMQNDLQYGYNAQNKRMVKVRSL